MTMHRSKSAIAAQCPIRDVLDRLGDRWTVLVLRELKDGTLRFSVLKARIADISQRMLAQTLRRLEQDRLVLRTVHPVVPPRVDYGLTALGESLLVPLEGMVQWADENHDAVRVARSRYIPPEPNRPR